MYQKYVKRMFDVLLSALAIIMLSPFIALIAIWIKLDSRGTVLFKQRRVGKDKQLFTILKFRTMSTTAPKDVPTHQLHDYKKYITRSGQLLRKTSLDELPQIWNIFIGEMSIIGPRPALWNQYDLIIERDKYGVNSLTPGLTGWSQINGRDELEIEVKARLDGEYAQNIGFWMDVRCFMGSVLAVFDGKGVVEGGTGAIERRR